MEILDLTSRSIDDLYTMAMQIESELGRRANLGDQDAINAVRRRGLSRATIKRDLEALHDRKS